VKILTLPRSGQDCGYNIEGARKPRGGKLFKKPDSKGNRDRKQMAGAGDALPKEALNVREAGGDESPKKRVVTRAIAGRKAPSSAALMGAGSRPRRV